MSDKCRRCRVVLKTKLTKRDGHICKTCGYPVDSSKDNMNHEMLVDEFLRNAPKKPKGKQKRKK